ncbi:Protein CYP-14A5 [Aphelenchoides avenae]|nr:Protein CYP-14A5 [Aphelenchus avenae]
MLLLILFTLLLAYIVSYYLYVSRHPPGPRPLLLVGNLLQIADKEFPSYVDELSKKYGPVFTLFMPYPTVMVTSYESIKEAVVTKGEHFSGRLQLPPLSFFNYVPNSGVFMSVGDNWREQRRMALTILRDFGMGKSLMEEKVMNSVNEMVHQLSQLEDKSKVDVPRILQVCVGNTINEMLFGYTYSYDEAGIGKMMEYVELMHSFFVDMAAPEMLIIQAYPWAKNMPFLRTAYQRAKTNMEKYHEFIEREVKAQEESFSVDAEPTTFVQAYLKEMIDSKNPFLNRDQLVSVATDFWAGGMETTSLTLMWAILFLMKWPDVQRKAQEEIAEFVGQDRFPAISDKPNMPYTSALMQEILRCANISTFEPHMDTSQS